jgi:hypothetical protein
MPSGWLELLHTAPARERRSERSDRTARNHTFAASIPVHAGDALFWVSFTRFAHRCISNFCVNFPARSGLRQQSITIVPARPLTSIGPSADRKLRREPDGRLDCTPVARRGKERRTNAALTGVRSNPRRRSSIRSCAPATPLRVLQDRGRFS